MTQVCTVLEALRVAQAEVIRATVPEEAKGVREHFYDAAAAYDESHGDDVRHPTCRMCAEALGDDDDEFRTWSHAPRRFALACKLSQGSG